MVGRSSDCQLSTTANVSWLSRQMSVCCTESLWQATDWTQLTLWWSKWLIGFLDWMTFRHLVEIAGDCLTGWFMDNSWWKWMMLSDYKPLFTATLSSISPPPSYAFFFLFYFCSMHHNSNEPKHNEMGNQTVKKHRANTWVVTQITLHWS